MNKLLSLSTLNQNDVKCTFQGPQDYPVTPPPPPPPTRLPSTGYPMIGIFPGQGDDPFPSRVSLKEFVVPITLLSFFFFFNFYYS